MHYVWCSQLQQGDVQLQPLTVDSTHCSSQAWHKVSSLLAAAARTDAEPIALATHWPTIGACTQICTQANEDNDTLQWCSCSQLLQTGACSTLMCNAHLANNGCHRVLAGCTLSSARPSRMLDSCCGLSARGSSLSTATTACGCIIQTMIKHTWVNIL